MHCLIRINLVHRHLKLNRVYNNLGLSDSELRKLRSQIYSCSGNVLRKRKKIRTRIRTRGRVKLIDKTDVMKSVSKEMSRKTRKEALHI